MGFANEVSTTIQCGNPEVRRGFFSMVNLLRQIANQDDMFRRLFSDNMERLLETHKRFPGHLQRETFTWLSGDATPLVLAEANWATLGFFRFRPGEVLSIFTPSAQTPYIISECELAVSVMGAVPCASHGNTQFFMLGTDNLNAISWMNGGKAKEGTAMRTLFCFYR